MRVFRRDLSRTLAPNSIAERLHNSDEGEVKIKIKIDVNVPPNDSASTLTLA